MTLAGCARAAHAAALVLLATALLAPATQARAAVPPPTISAPEAIVVEASTGDVAYRLRADRRRPIASTTKLMTALLTLRRARLDQAFVAAPYDPAPAESRINLRAGERLTVRDLLRGLLLASANDAAATLAQGVAGSESAFVGAMNREARRLGLRGTSFANPIGLDDPANYSTARDLATLAIALRRSAFARATMNLPRATLSTGARVRRVANRNLLVRRVPWVNGVKTGYTGSAGYVLVGSARRAGVNVVSVVLAEPSDQARFRDTLALLRWGLGRYRRVRPVVRGRTLARAKVRYGGDATVALAPARSSARVVRRGRRVTALPRVPRELEGPLPAGRRVGTVLVRVGRRVVDRVPVITARPVPAPSRVEQVKEAVLRPWALALICVGVLLAASLPLALSRRRRRTPA